MYVYLCCEKKDFSAGDKNSSERDTMLNGQETCVYVIFSMVINPHPHPRRSFTTIAHTLIVIMYLG